jgi:hypothetical protein
MMSGQCELLDNRKLVGQLVGLERMVGRNRDVVDHPRGQHDDIANCVAGVLVNVLADVAGGFGFLDFVSSGRAQQLLDRVPVREEVAPIQTPTTEHERWWAEEKRRLMGGDE